MLLNNGCDHFPVQRDLDRVLGALREAFPDTDFRVSGYEDFLHEVRRAGPPETAYEGELLGGKLHHILSGVWSTRMYLKQANERAQVLLADMVEPMAAALHFVHRLEYPDGLIREAWRELLRNHPHDSICGCSTDEVHREMESRFESVLRTGDQLLRRGLKSVAPTFGTRPEADHETVLCVANSLPFERTEVVRRLVVLQPPGIDPQRLELLDESGHPVPLVVERVQRVERFWGIDYRVELDGAAQLERYGVYEERFGDRIIRPESERETADTFLTLEFLAPLPATGHARFFLVERPAGSEVRPVEWPNAVWTDGREVGNGLVRVRLHPDGTFDLRDERTGRDYGGLNLLEDTGDVGDEYDYSEAPGSEPVTAAGVAGEVRTLRDGPGSAVLAASFELRLPAAARANREGRVRQEVPCPVEVRVELTADCPVVRVETRIDNRVEDHRLRARFPTGIVTDHVWSDGHYMVNRRPVEREEGDGWVQSRPPTSPQQEYSVVQDGERGLAVLNRGLPEIEALRDSNGAVELALTLLRSVGWLSRDDFDSRGRSNAGPTLFTPEAQCPGPRVARYAVLPFDGDLFDAEVREASRRYRVRPVAVQGVREGSVAGGTSLLRQRGAATVTAIKKHRERDTLIVRLYNPRSSREREVLTSDLPITGAWRTDLLEERTAPIAQDDGGVAVALGPHEIVTLELEVSLSGR